MPSVLRAPRLVLFPVVDRHLAVRASEAIATFLRSWHVPVHLYVEGPVDISGPVPDAMPIEDKGSVSSLLESSWRTAGADERHLANGGDFTIVTGDSSSAAILIAAAKATGTPVVLVVSSHADNSSVATAVSQMQQQSEVEPVGILRVRTAGDGVESESPSASPVEMGVLTTLPMRSDGQVERFDADAWDRHMRSVDIRRLMLAAMDAPTLVYPHATSETQRTPRTRVVRAGQRQRGVALAVYGTHSSAGKSFIVSALARYFSDRGLRVAPFKGQNMSNNARVVDGGEIGVAQYIQALAARAVPDVRMNPVLLKPLANGSSVIAAGRTDDALDAVPWRIRKPILWPIVEAALQDLLQEFDLVVIEGAGSPSDNYLYHNDIVNMRVARAADAPVLLVTDSGRGGAVPHCYGSWFLLPEEDRSAVKGFLFNRFYKTGNVAMMEPGCSSLQRLTGVSTLGIVPEIDHALPDEDLHSLEELGRPTRDGEPFSVAIVSYPYMSNFDEFTLLGQIEGCRTVWAQSPEQIALADLVIVPGSRDVAADVRWVRERGLEPALRSHLLAGRRMLAICGGMQMVGHSLEDPYGVDGGDEAGLGFLPLVTRYAETKVQRSGAVRLATSGTAWDTLDGVTFDGYEIRHGRTRSTGSVTEVLTDGRGYALGSLLAIYPHGMLESTEVLRALFGDRANQVRPLDDTFNRLGDLVRDHMDLELLDEIVFGRRAAGGP